MVGRCLLDKDGGGVPLVGEDVGGGLGDGSCEGEEGAATGEHLYLGKMFYH